MLDQLTIQQSTLSGSWIPKAKVHALQSDPLVSVIQLPNTTLAVPSLTESGVVLNKIKGDLHDVKEMDLMNSHGFKSSFILHHLSNAPIGSAVSAILPDDGPNVPST